MANVYDMSDTWNDGATTFTSIKMDVTDTASDASSLLMDLQVGGASQFLVGKNGEIYFGTGSKRVEITDPYGLRVTTGSWLDFSINTNAIARMTTTGWAVNRILFGRTTGYQTILQQDGDTLYTLAQRNGTNAQTFNIYNTYTDESNYERGFMKWNSNVLEIGTEAAGTGSNRVVRLTGSNGLELRHSFNKFISVQAGGIYVWSGPGSSALSGFVNSELRLSAGSLGFSSGNVITASDAGLARESAGVIKVTNGSTGTGELIFIVPTTDPGITGALWNNAGTLSISA